MWICCSTPKPRRRSGLSWTLLEALSADASTPRLDGELILPGGGAVAWREFARRPDELLVKGAGGPALRPRPSVEALLTGAAA